MSRARRLSAWLPVAGLCALVLAAVPELTAFGGLARALWGRSLLERGRFAADEGRNFVVRAGHVQLRRRLAPVPVDRRPPSGVAAGWVWAVDAAESLPPDARVYLDVPLSQYYYYGNYFWYPARVAVNTVPVEIDDDASFGRAARPVPPSEFGRLASLGFTHVVVSLPGSMPGILELKPPEPAGP